MGNRGETTGLSRVAVVVAVDAAVCHGERVELLLELQYDPTNSSLDCCSKGLSWRLVRAGDTIASANLH